MTRKKKPTPKSSPSFVITRYNIAIPCIAWGVLYLFCLIVAKSSPLFAALTSVGNIVVGQIGSMATALLLVGFGSICIARGSLIATFTKQLVAINILISALLNFPLIANPVASWTQHGGYLSRPLLQLLQQLFGKNLLAIQIVVIAAIIGVIIRRLVTLQLQLPTVSLDTLKSSISKRKESDWLDRTAWSPKEAPLQARPLASGSLMNQVVSPPTDLKQLLTAKLAEAMGKTTKTTSQIPLSPKPSYPRDKPTFDISLLPVNTTTVHVDQDWINHKSLLIQSKLAEFGIGIAIQWHNIGPAVIQIKVTPDTGVKISQIESHKSDLMLVLKVKSLRILAPLPGTDSVGIEIPNPKPTMVRLSEVLWSAEFAQQMQKNLTNLTLWKGIDGSLIIKSLEKMPHLLIAGATGQWKSVGVNDFILSLMYQNTPDELKFIMIDPKQVEMEIYDGLPYLLCPIITDSEKALKALTRAANEMDVRYSSLKLRQVRNLTEYNAVSDVPLHRIVLVIDEFADLIMTGKKKDIELMINRIAQKARAVGIHLMLATQRPDKEIVTGLIKSNIPARVAFGVVSRVNSNIILGTKWAEDLLGKGDMLYLDDSQKDPLRIQAPFLDTPETKLVVDAIKKKYMKNLTVEEVYDIDLMESLEAKTTTGIFATSSGSDDDDHLVSQAIELIKDKRKASASMLQTKLKIGFARASRVMDILEEQWIVGPAENGKPRDVLI